MSDFQRQLVQIISENLPGEAAHVRMAPLNRPLSSFAMKNAENVRESAVAVMLFEENDTYNCTLIQRPSYEGSHSGQISFPGGKRETSDANLEETAVRECMEEVGIDLKKGTMLGKLTPVYIPVSNFHVEPYLFFYPELPEFKPDQREVESILTISIDDLLDEGKITTMNVSMPNGYELREVPCFEINGKQIWGATALILNELKEILKIMGI